jgi:hypothetical protein
VRGTVKGLWRFAYPGASNAFEDGPGALTTGMAIVWICAVEAADHILPIALVPMQPAMELSQARHADLLSAIVCSCNLDSKKGSVYSNTLY